MLSNVNSQTRNIMLNSALIYRVAFNKPLRSCKAHKNFRWPTERGLVAVHVTDTVYTCFFKVSHISGGCVGFSEPCMTLYTWWLFTMLQVDLTLQPVFGFATRQKPHEFSPNEKCAPQKSPPKKHGKNHVLHLRGKNSASPSTPQPTNKNTPLLPPVTNFNLGLL